MPQGHIVDHSGSQYGREESPADTDCLKKWNLQ